MLRSRWMPRRGRPVLLGAVLLAAALPAQAADLSGCFRLSAQDRATLEAWAAAGCHTAGSQCELHALSVEEAKEKVREVQEFNAAHAGDVPARWRKLLSGLGVCDGVRQVYAIEEHVEAQNPQTQSGTKPHWNPSKGGQSVFTDPKGRRWQFPDRIEEGGIPYTLDRTKPPTVQQNGVLVQALGHYVGPKGTSYRYQKVGTLLPPEELQAPPAMRLPTVPQSSQRPTRAEICARSPQSYSCLYGTN
ncbi:MAG: hypothetical protein GC199_09240 [Alphaproteobacteria bacterium]|nr:hypothetical protein [Alphaproteobacteria bacterium]